MEYLYFLQCLREGALSFLTPLMVVISEMAMYIAPVMVAIVFWVVDKEMGTYMVFNTFGSQLLCNTIKLTACVYRPWVRDSRLHIAKAVEKSATGYSFPSGHTCMAASTYSVLGYNLRKKKALSVFFYVLIVLTAFSRNYLGAHTIWDVLMAIAVTFVCIVVNGFIMKMLRNKPQTDIYVLVGGIIISIVCILYFQFKPYPMEYDLAGNLLVDPKVMALDGIASVGFLSGGIIGWFIERRFISFEVKTDRLGKVLRIVLGVGSFAILYLWLFKKLEHSAFVPVEIGKFLRTFLTVLYATVVFPIGIKIISKKRKNKMS